MGINLQKGQKIDLTKGNPDLSKLIVGLGWDPIASRTRGANIDCDASAIILNNEGKMSELVYFGNKKNKSKSIIHSGDNLTGEGDGDDEQIFVEIKKIPENISKIIFVVNIYSCENRKQDFGMIENAYIRILDANKNNEMAKFNLSDDFSGKTSLIVAEIYRYNGEWKFNPIGQGSFHKKIDEITKEYK